MRRDNIILRMRRAQGCGMNRKRKTKLLYASMCFFGLVGIFAAATRQWDVESVIVVTIMFVMIIVLALKESLVGDDLREQNAELKYQLGKAEKRIDIVTQVQNERNRGSRGG